ncbi:MAG TPA: glutathione S-transferase family protein [Stellaceae bacterium]|nr:glutathione S-transferase family protein [Stellaceae bacterium]
MGLTIYGIPRSRAFRNLWACGELGIKYEHVMTDFSDGPNSCRAPAFKAVNPNAAVPVIDDDGFKLWESLAINMYLAKKHPDKGLYAKSLQDEAKVWQWALWTATTVEGPIATWQSHAMMLPAEKRDPKQAAEALQKLAGPFQVLDDHLKAQQYLVGSQFTVADLNLASVMSRATAMDLSAAPNVKAWLDRCLDRPAAQAALKRRAT